MKCCQNLVSDIITRQCWVRRYALNVSQVMGRSLMNDFNHFELHLNQFRYREPFSATKETFSATKEPFSATVNRFQLHEKHFSYLEPFSATEKPFSG